ncbi:MAG: DUF2281 domain-containing protein [Bacteroidota bacterium]
MKTIKDLEKIPEPLKREVLDYAEYLSKKYNVDVKQQCKKRWADVSKRGSSQGETGSETINRMRGEDR